MDVGVQATQRHNERASERQVRSMATCKRHTGSVVQRSALSLRTHAPQALHCEDQTKPIHPNQTKAKELEASCDLLACISQQGHARSLVCHVVSLGIEWTASKQPGNHSTRQTPGRQALGFRL